MHKVVRRRFDKSYLDLFSPVYHPLLLELPKCYRKMLIERLHEKNILNFMIPTNEIEILLKAYVHSYMQYLQHDRDAKRLIALGVKKDKYENLKLQFDKLKQEYNDLMNKYLELKQIQ